MKRETNRSLTAVLLCAAVIAVSGCGGEEPVINAETIPPSSKPVTAATSVSVPEKTAETTAFASTTAAETTAPAEEKSEHSFRKGVWLAKSADDSEEDETGGFYWYIDDEGARFRDRATGVGGRIVYELNGDEGVFYSGENPGEGTASPFTVSGNGDTLRITYKGGGHVTTLQYITDDTDGFRFYTEDELAEMALAYYAAGHDGQVPTGVAAGSEDDNTVLIQLYDNDSYSLNATCAWYFVDRFTAKGRDIDGRDIDLTASGTADGAQDSGAALKTGVWWLKDKDYGGEIWVIQDNRTGYVTELINGMGHGFTYESDGSGGVFRYHGTAAGGAESFVVSDGEIILGLSRKLTYLTDKSDGFVVYSNADLANNAAKYYASTHDGHFPAKAVWGIEDNDLVRIRLFDDDSRSNSALNEWYFLIQDEKEESGWTYTEIARYTIDRFTGKGTDSDGGKVDISYTTLVPEKWSPSVIQRQVMLDNGEFFGVRYLGYIDPSVDSLDDAVREILQNTGTAEDFPFVNEMPADRFVSSRSGQELYLIIPFDAQGTVKVCPQAAPGEDGTDFVQLLYDSSDGGPFLLKCSAGEIYPDVKVIMTDSAGEATEWYPGISGESGHVLTATSGTDMKVHDFTDYGRLAGAYPAEENTYGG
ncbi:MAG: hypothetical protein J6O50_15935 [Ruminiclostridium sp.]|nr:hypothetical protein [Ruminiclostridium sp.]